MTVKKSRNKRIMIAVIASIGGASAILLQVTPWMSTFLHSKRQAETSITSTTTTKPVLTIKPLPVRPVTSAFVTTPDQCPPPTPVPPDKPMRVCDIEKTAVYELEPESMRMQLVKVEAFRNPLTGVELVQMTMTPESAEEFSKFTATQIDKQVAFVRGGAVVWAPKIAEPIEGTVLQLSGEKLTPEQAAEIARKMKDET